MPHARLRSPWSVLLALPVLALMPLGAHAATFGEPDLAPYLADGPWAEAEAHLEAGRAEAAAQVLAGVEAPEASPAAAAHAVLLARLAEASGDAAAAGRAWAEAARTDARAGPWLAARGVEAFLAADEMEEARALLGRIPEAHSALAPVRLAVAHALVAADEDAQALKVLGDPAAWPAGQRPVALALAARLEAEAGQGKRAAALWRRLFLEHPAAPAARDAETQMRALGARPATPGEAVARLEKLLDAHRNEQVAREAEDVLARLAPASDSWCRARYAQGKAHRKARAYHEAIEVLGDVAERCPDPGLRVRALYLWGSALSIARGDPAIPVYERLAREFSTHSFADDALFYVADLHRRGDRLGEALSVLERQANRFPQGDFHAEALWRSFWLRHLDGRSEEGLPWLDRALSEHGDDPFEASRARYWKARVAAESGDLEAAAEGYAQVFSGHPLTFYGTLALTRLQALDAERAAALVAALPPRPVEVASPVLDVRPAFAAEEAVAGGIHLLRLGLLPEAARVLRGAHRAAATDDEYLALALLLERAGDPGSAHRLLRTRAERFAGAWPTGSSWRIWRAAYPLAFRSLVERATGEFGVPTDLQQAIIREESALDPAIVSWAGAVGLAQLMPATAGDVARRLGLAGVTTAQLKDPGLNLRLSARYLSDLLRIVDGHPALAIAAYNGGPRTVSGWLKDRGDLELDAFVESMTIAETRGYTRRVLKTWATYRYLYGTGEGRFLRVPLQVK